MSKKLAYLGAALLITLCASSQTPPNKENSKANEKSQIPGILETVQELIKIEREREKSLIEKSSKNQLLLTTVDAVDQVKIAPTFLRSMIFHTKHEYLRLAGSDECQFYSLLDNDLLKSSRGRINNIPIVYTNKKGETFNAYTPKENLLKFIYQRNCFESKQTRKLFTESNLDSTLETINFPTPKTTKECQKIHDNWINNRYLPYLCRIPDTMNQVEKSERRVSTLNRSQVMKKRYYEGIISEGKDYLEQVDSFQRSYLKNLCSNLYSPQRFCADYLAKDIWTKVINEEEPDYKINYKCALYLDKNYKKITKTDQKECASAFKSKSSLCQTISSRFFPSHFPLPTCEAQSQALVNSNLVAKYRDCPGNVDNQGITNIHRIIKHIEESDATSTPETCASEANYSLAKMLIDFDSEEAWPLQVCYPSQVIEDSTLCESYIPGHHEKTDLAETKVVAGIIEKLVSTPSNVKCQMVPKTKYNPQRLGYKSGCHIVYDESNCTPLSCPKSIHYNQDEMTQISYKGVAEFEYFPNSFSNEKFSLSNIIEETYKVDFDKIRNRTELKYYFDKNSKGIIHGIGCLEEFMPRFFKRKRINACRPVPFIIDGYQEEGADTLLTIRTGIDQVQSPQRVTWNRLFNALSAYKRLHPLSLWALYGIK